MMVVEETLNKKWNWWPLFPLYPYGKKKTILKELIPDQIWSLEQIQGLYYVAVPIRMTVIKVDNGLMLINPLPPTKELKNELEKLKSSNADESTGIQIINKAIETPLRTIVENSGGEGSVVVSKVLDGDKNFGYNAKEGKYVDMLKEGIIDPKKVTRVALENAASVAGMILTTECALVDIKEDNPAPMPPMGGGGMPGMM
jgi:hypothetical protein